MIAVANNMRLHILLWYVPMMGVGFKGSWEFIMLTHIIHSTLSVLWVPRYNMFEQFPVLSRQWRPAHVFSPGWGKPSKENMMGAPTPWICIPVCSYEEDEPRLNIGIMTVTIHVMIIHCVYKSGAAHHGALDPGWPELSCPKMAWTRTESRHGQRRGQKHTARPLRSSSNAAHWDPHFLRVWSGMVGKMPPNCWVNVGNYMVSGQIKWTITLFTCGKETRLNESPISFTHFQVLHRNASGADLVFQCCHCCHVATFSDNVARIPNSFLETPPEHRSKLLNQTTDPEKLANRWIHLNTTLNCPK